MNEPLTPSQAKIVDAVAASGPASAQRIAEVTGLAYSTVTALLRKLAITGLVERQDDATWVANTSKAPQQPVTHSHPADQTATAEPTVDGYAEGTNERANLPNSAQPADRDEHDTAASDGVALTEVPNDHSQPEPEADATVGDIDPNGETDDGEAGEGEAPDACSDEATQQTVAVGRPSAEQSAADVEGGDDAVVASGPRRRYNKTDKPKRAKGQLYQEVRSYFLTHPGETLSPRLIGKAIDASDGAVVNVCHKLVTAGDISEASGDKVAFLYTPPNN